MSLWLWTFWTYSFLGYLLERGYAIATHADRQARKCFLLLPMCPVYGLGALAVLALPEACRDAGSSQLASAVELAGAAAALVCALPLISALLDTVEGLV